MHSGWLCGAAETCLNWSKAAQSGLKVFFSFPPKRLDETLEAMNTSAYVGQVILWTLENSFDTRLLGRMNSMTQPLANIYIPHLKPQSET